MNGDFLASLRARAGQLGVRVAGYAPQRYVVAPEAREMLVVYVEDQGLALSHAFGLDYAPRFANVVLHSVDAPTVFFDPHEADGFPWCPPLEVYLHLMAGGKRERASAETLRPALVERAET